MDYFTTVMLAYFLIGGYLILGAIAEVVFWNE